MQDTLILLIIEAWNSTQATARIVLECRVSDGIVTIPGFTQKIRLTKSLRRCISQTRIAETYQYPSHSRAFADASAKQESLSRINNRLNQEPSPMHQPKELVRCIDTRLTRNSLPTSGQKYVAVLIRSPQKSLLPSIRFTSSYREGNPSVSRAR